MIARRTSLGLTTLLLGMSLSSAALAQAPAATTTPPPMAPAPAAAPAPTAPMSPPPPAAQPTSPAALPPGYMLVPIPDQSPQTRYDVQYPQARGALPPGMELPYEEGDPIPPGYRLRKQPRRGLVVAGSIMTGVAWGLSLTSAVAADFDNQSGFLVIPALGPWLMLLAGGAKNDCAASDDFCDNNSGLRAVLVLDGLVQTTGAVLFIAGFAAPRMRLVRQDVTVGLAPVQFGRGGYGVGAVGTF